MENKFLLTNEEISYSKAIWLALGQLMSKDKKVLIYGLGVDDPKAMYETLSQFPKIFGVDRCFDTPLSEDSLTGYGIGLAISGFKPIHVHQRTDFLLLCCNQLINIAAKVKYLSNGNLACPFVVRAITGRSWGQGSQHSQSFHSMFASIPGLRVLTPSTPQDVFNSYLNVFNDKIPTIIIEHRMLYKTKSRIKKLDNVPMMTEISSGEKITLCSISHMTLEVQKVSDALEKREIFCDHFTIVDHSNLDINILLKSVKKTKKLLIIDHGWLKCSIVHTISHLLRQKGFNGIIKTLGYSECPCPTSQILENHFYPTATSIMEAICDLLELPFDKFDKLPISEELVNFKGPF